MAEIRSPTAAEVPALDESPSEDWLPWDVDLVSKASKPPSQGDELPSGRAFATTRGTGQNCPPSVPAKTEPIYVEGLESLANALALRTTKHLRELSVVEDNLQGVCEDLLPNKQLVSQRQEQHTLTQKGASMAYDFARQEWQDWC